MSGDVQPRKRKDKKKKKETSEEIPPVQSASAQISTDEVNIHVHKENTTGGEFCAKCIFFVVMAVIAVVIGLAIVEYRGQTDLDAFSTESRFAPLFEGWIDKSPQDNNNHDEHEDDIPIEHSEEIEEEEEDKPNDIQEETEGSQEEDEEEDKPDDIQEEEEEEDATSQPEDDDDDDDNKDPQESDEAEADEQQEEDEDEINQSEEEEEDEEKGEIDEVDEDETQSSILDDLTTQTGGVKVLPDNDDDEEVEEVQDEGQSESDEDKTIRKKSGAQSFYAFANITNEDDYVIRDDLDVADKHLEDNIPLALSLFTKILEKNPRSPRALYGKAQALDMWADKRRSNEVLQDSVKFYFQVLKENDVPDLLFVAAAERCINRMRFVGQYGRAVGVHKLLIDRFPADIKFRNQLAVTYLTINRIPEARQNLLETLQRWPNDGFTLVHYGFILKTVDNNLEKAIVYLRRGIDTREDGVIDGRFYFHLGDALARLGKRDEAMKVYEEGVDNNVFLSKYQRSLYNVNRLTARPWWSKHQIPPYTKFCDDLEQNWKDIRDEGLSVLNSRGLFKDESENLRDVGDWKQFELYARGIKHVGNCNKCPVTCKIVDTLAEARSCKRGQVKFSVMHPGTHVWPHCGPTNCRLRIHLGLKVPPSTFIRVAEDTRSWEEGKVLIFDDSFEHEVWHNGTEFRLVLIVDVWHPELTRREQQSLSAI